MNLKSSKFRFNQKDIEKNTKEIKNFSFKNKKYEICPQLFKSAILGNKLNKVFVLMK